MTFRALCLAPVLAMLAAAPALANTKLVLAQPGPRSVVALPLRVLVLSFSAPVDVAFSDVTITDSQGDPIAAARPQAVAGQPFELAVPVNITHGGRYTVTWQVSAYAQHTTGHYSFTVTQ
ncbi:copper resistance CopC family protein [Acidocella sp.]|jgi:methionine-rich copper-binding protein CopC|uniref:copper resistance CopC family protein n=1 Tax=Acidocella sp. TaxID=50710 RepID=UPI002F423409